MMWVTVIDVTLSVVGMAAYLAAWTTYRRTKAMVDRYPGWSGIAKPVRYVMPGPPVTGRRVTAGGRLWLRGPDGLFTEQPSLLTAENPPPTEWTWQELLSRWPVLELVELTAEEIESETLYGPIGARWGRPDDPCPYAVTGGPTWPGGYCAMGRGHIGLHKDAEGNVLGPQPRRSDTDGDSRRSPARVSAEDLATYCTCGHPAEHQPGCPRYPRISGGRS